MKSVISPDYIQLEAELKGLAEGQYTPLQTFCNNRNTVELVEIGGRQMVLKKYKPTGLFTGILYTFFRRTKGRRAYEHALRLLATGISTPKPVAYFEEKRRGLFHKGYFISEYVDLPTLYKPYYDLEHGFTDEERKNVSYQLAEYTLDLHNRGIMPLDFNMANIMWQKEGDKYHFTLIDINRMRFGKVKGLHRKMLSFFQLGTYYPFHRIMLENYCYLTGYDLEDCLYHIIGYRRHQRFLRRIKSFFKPRRYNK